MGDVFEDAVSAWLQARGYFMMSNIPYGNNQEIDLLAMRPRSDRVLHVEVTCSSNPVSMLGTSRAGAAEHERYATDYATKKFLNDQAIARIREICGADLGIDNLLVYAKLRDERQLQVIADLGISSKPIKEVVDEIRQFKLNAFAGDRRLKQLLDLI